MHRPLPGTPKSDIDTPALLVDLDLMEANIERMASRFAGRPAKLRPHAKTHKSPRGARRQRERGACGITCAKLGEAEGMVQGGVTDILIANQLVGAPKMIRLAELARGARITVAVDHGVQVESLATHASRSGVEIGVLIEVDVGMGRCGVRSTEELIVLAECIGRTRGLAFHGLQGYEGHCVFIKDARQRREQADLAYRTLAQAREELERRGLPVETISGGGTGTYAQALEAGVLTEVQAGSYVFMDGRYRGIEGLDFDCALSVLTTVISRPDRTCVVTDCGMKSVSTDFGLPAAKGIDGLRCLKASEEHVVWEATGAVDVSIGDKLEIIPAHGCTTINLHDDYCGLRNGIVETVWPIAGRGKSA